MKYVENYKDYSKLSKSEYKGPKDNYRFSNMHDDGKGNIIGNCKNCGAKNIDVAEHSNRGACPFYNEQ